MNNDPVEVTADALLEAIRDRHEAMRPEDKTLLRAIEAESDAYQVAALLMAYYRDVDRANRTPRAFLYLHIGMLCGALRST